MNVNYELFLDLFILTIHGDDKDGKITILTEDITAIFEENRFSIRDEQLIVLLIKLIKETVQLKLSFKSNKPDLLRLFKKYKQDMILVNFPDVVDSLENIIKNEIAANSIINIYERATNFIVWHKATKAVSKMYVNLKKVSDSTNPVTQKGHLANTFNLINELKEDLSISAKKESCFVERINFSNISDIKASLSRYKERTINHTIKTGLQGLNNMFGPRKSIALGESVIFGGLSHNFKSGMLMSMAKWAVEYNIPPRDPDGRKPMILFISLENEAFQNMMWLYRQIFVVLHGDSPPDNMTDDEIVEFIYDYFSKKEYTLVIERYLPERFGYDDYVELYEMYEKAGYKIVMSIVDYLSQMNLLSRGPSAFGSAQNNLLIKSHFMKMCNFNKSKGTTLVSAHQLNREAGKIVATGIPYPIKRFSGVHLAFSADVEREPDLFIFLNIEKNKYGESFLTMKWIRHRYVDDTPEKDKFVCYKFEHSGIPDDINKEYAGIKDIHFKRKDDNEVEVSEIDKMIDETF